MISSVWSNMNKTEKKPKTYNFNSMYSNVKNCVNSKGQYFMYIFITYLKPLEQTPSQITGGLPAANAKNILS